MILQGLIPALSRASTFDDALAAASRDADFSLDASQLVVAHDELDIPFDAMKLKQGGGHGGHNGIRDIISSAGTGDFTRVRIGIGRPPGRQDAADFVLKPFSSTERQVLPNVLEDAADAIEMIAADGLIAAQLRFHTAAS